VRDESDRPDTRRPRSVYGVGTEPDPRFSLANERTALAWVRTSLALVAGGVAVTSLATLADLPAFLDVVAVVICLIGAAVAVASWVSWQRTERAIRAGQPLPPPIVLRVLVVSVAVLALVMAGYAVVRVVGG
jgi:putative membrane protein